MQSQQEYNRNQMLFAYDRDSHKLYVFTFRLSFFLTLAFLEFVFWFWHLTQASVSYVTAQCLEQQDSLTHITEWVQNSLSQTLFYSDLKITNKYLYLSHNKI